MDDKIWFAEHCHEQGVRAVPVLMHFSKGERQPLKGGSDVLPDGDLFVKPRSGSGGHRMERWDFIGEGPLSQRPWRGPHARRTDGEALPPVAQG